MSNLKNIIKSLFVVVLVALSLFVAIETAGNKNDLKISPSINAEGVTAKR
jgi:hypothetical protein